ncbi:MAG: hypothetical protein KA779_11455 [Propionivibrio sp.]|nr:hypothetical protein [Propionivibrio sp.]
MQVKEDHLTEVVDAILRYLASHPDAADTSEGIAKWWVPTERGVDTDAVRSALARLEAQGLVHRRINADKHVVYSR